MIPKGAPSFGTDPNDSHIWYYNGTPAACTFFALDYGTIPIQSLGIEWYNNENSRAQILQWRSCRSAGVWTKFWRQSGFVSIFWHACFTPCAHEVQALSCILYPERLVQRIHFHHPSSLLPLTDSIRGYAAVERSDPAIAFSGGNGGQRSYKEINATTKSDFPDPATIDAQLSVDVVNQLAKNGNGSQLLPFGYGINVNYPEITSFIDSYCVKPPFYQTRMTGGAGVDTAVFNESTGLFKYGSIVSAGLNTCINGDCSLPGETNVVDSGCFTAVTVFTVDYDAPDCVGSANVRPLLQPLVQYQNSTTNATKSVKGNIHPRSPRVRLTGA